jgi:hypothetical protein
MSATGHRGRPVLGMQPTGEEGKDEAAESSGRQVRPSEDDLGSRRRGYGHLVYWEERTEGEAVSLWRFWGAVIAVLFAIGLAGRAFGWA